MIIMKRFLLVCVLWVRKCVMLIVIDHFTRRTSPRVKRKPWERRSFLKYCRSLDELCDPDRKSRVELDLLLYGLLVVELRNTFITVLHYRMVGDISDLISLYTLHWTILAFEYRINYVIAFENRYYVFVLNAWRLTHIVQFLHDHILDAEWLATISKC